MRKYGFLKIQEIWRGYPENLVGVYHTPPRFCWMTQNEMLVKIYTLQKTYDPKIWKFFKLVCNLCKGSALEKNHLKRNCPVLHARIRNETGIREKTEKRRCRHRRKSKEELMAEVGEVYDRGKNTWARACCFGPKNLGDLVPFFDGADPSTF